MGDQAEPALQMPAWHNDQDVDVVRAAVHQQIFALFQKRKPGGQNQWSEKLPDFVKRLESALFNSAQTKEDYCDFKTLEGRLQDVARRLVHRPGSQGPSSSQGTPGLLPNGVIDTGSVQQQQQAAQEPGVQPGIPSNTQMMLSAYPGAQGMQPGSGMIPTPNTTLGDSTDLLSVKPEPGSSANSMVPLEGAADPTSKFQGGSMPGMVPVSGGVGNSSMGGALMSNGAPVLIKQDHWSMPSPGMVPTTAGGGRIGDPNAAMVSSSAPSAFMPTSAAGGGMMPNPGSSMGGGGMMMGMMPNATGMMPNGMIPNGMMPGSMGMVANVSPTMIPNPGSMVPASMGMPAASMVMVPSSMGMVPSSMGMVPSSMGMGPSSMGMVPSSMGMPSPAVDPAAAAALGALGVNGMYVAGGMGSMASPPLQAGQQQLAQQPDAGQLPQQEQQQQLVQQQDVLQQMGRQQQAVMQQQQQPGSAGAAAAANMPSTMVPVMGPRSSSPGMGGLSLPGMDMQGDAAAAAARGSNMQQFQQQQGQGQGQQAQQQQQQGQQQGQGQDDILQQQHFLSGGGNENASRSLQERQQYIQKQQRWLLFLRHCAKCQQDEAECQFSRSCRVGKELWTHILQCNDPNCTYPRCTSSKDLLKHHQKCQNVQCPICTPVKEYVRRTRNQGGGSGIDQGAAVPGPAQPSSSVTSAPTPGAGDMAAQYQQLAATAGQQQMQQPGLSGMKRSASSMMDPAAAAAAAAAASMQVPSGYPQGMMPVPGGGMMGMMPQQQQMQYNQQQAYMQQQQYGAMQQAYPQQMQYPPQQRMQAMQQPYAQQQMGYGQQHMPYGQQHAYLQQQQQQQQQMAYGQAAGMGAVGPGMTGMVPMGNGMPPNGAAVHGEEQVVKKQKTDQDKRELLAKNTGTSLLECFDAHAIHTHVTTTYEHAQTSKTQAQMPVNPGDECKVCGLTKLTFEPPCIYCTTCGQRIKRGQTYHCTAIEPGCEFRGFWCHGCLQEQKGDRVAWEGSQQGFVLKKDLQRKKNDDEVEEGWVQCDCCDNWVHMICGLFNKGKNDQNVHYLCPMCLQEGLTTGARERVKVRPQAMLEAKDLPSNNLSVLLEQRVLAAVAADRQARAAMQGLLPEQVLGAEGLNVRVINNVIKKCEVKQRFYEAFKGDGYPEAFIYRQRVIVLFQKIDGVDVALYCMYVQEYGQDCAPPNRNVVYLSYIDSVKYFRPEIQTAHGPSLRTFVYHQILLGYLAYVKQLGFEQMYIWACPPLAGDDYILYCHPSKQKTPRSDRLRNWYHDMLKKAREEGSVTHITTLWDSFFEGGRDHRYDKPSVTNIPYLEGDYWPGEAENLLTQIQDGQRSTTSGGNTALSRKAGGAKGKRYGAGPATTDEALLTRLGEILGGNMKEDFMVVHLQEPCSFCRSHVHGDVLHKYIGGAAGSSALSRPPPERRFEGIRLADGSGPAAPTGPLAHLQICGNCYSNEMTRVASGAKSRLPGTLTLNDLSQQPIQALQITQDRDADMGSEFFETRQAFLSLCQGNHYQFDSLRRAKHSSMMVLYHLHNPEAPAFSSTCNFCHVEIEPGTGLRCTVCTDFDMCNNCSAKGMQHQHPMVRTTDFARRDETRQRLTEQERQERSQQLQKTLTLLVHACSCHDPQCNSTSCRKVRQLFQHAVKCTQKVTGGCSLCKKMWCLLNLHAKSCTTSDCPVPRCRELKELRRRQQAQMETKRRAAYANMIRGQKA